MVQIQLWNDWSFVACLSEEYTYDTLEHHYYDVEPVESSSGAI